MRAIADYTDGELLQACRKLVDRLGRPVDDLPKSERHVLRARLRQLLPLPAGARRRHIEAAYANASVHDRNRLLELLDECGVRT